MKLQKFYFSLCVLVAHSMVNMYASSYGRAPQGGVVITPSTLSTVIASYVQPITTAGLIDQSFGAKGTVTTDVTGHNSVAYSCLVQPDGKIVVVGKGNNGVHDEMIVARYNSDGSLDTSFGINGVVKTDAGTNGSVAASCGMQSDGKIVVAGWESDLGLGYSIFAVARYNTNGSLDTTFGTNGIATTNVTTGNNSYANATSCIVQPDGKIIASGKGNLGGGHDVMALVRYNGNGLVDTAFGTAGIVTTDAGGIASVVGSSLLLPNGKIVAVGWQSNGVYTIFTLVRYNSNGLVDTTFGTGGAVTTDVTLGHSSQAYSALLQPDGKMIAVGVANSLFALVRYNSDGSRDTTFGNGGIVTTDATPGAASQANCCALQADGKIVAVGQGNNQFVVSRYNTDGSRDTTFGAGGIVTTSAATIGVRTTAALANGCALQPDGKIVSVGYTYTTLNIDGLFASARYINPFTLASFTASYGGVGVL